MYYCPPYEVILRVAGLVLAYALLWGPPALAGYCYGFYKGRILGRDQAFKRVADEKGLPCYECGEFLTGEKVRDRLQQRREVR